MTVRKERSCKRNRRRVVWQVKYGWNSFSQQRSPSMVARSGLPLLLGDKPFGQDRNVEGARQIFRQCYNASTCKRNQPRVVAPGRNRRLQVKVKSMFWLIGHSGQEIQNCVIGEKVEWFEGEGRIHSAQLGPVSEEVKCEADEKMEVDGEVDSKIKMDQRTKRFLSNCERRTISLICPRSSLLNKKRNGGKNCGILSKNGMISCQSIRRCKSCPKSCRVCRTYSSNARRRWASRRRRMNSSDPALKSSRLKWKTLEKEWRRKPWSKRNWTWRSRACRQEKEGEAATHLGRMGAASTQPSCSNLSRWEQSR